MLNHVFDILDTTPVQCIVIKVDGSQSYFQSAHSKISEYLGGSLQIIGAIPNTGIVATGLRSSDSDMNQNGLSFIEPCQGEVVLIKTTEDGTPCDIYQEDIRV
jgi:hypothetical protein